MIRFWQVAQRVARQAKEKTAEVHFYPITGMLREMRMIKMKVKE